nr:hypothetical protein 2 - rat [Rattus norvegicus]
MNITYHKRFLFLPSSVKSTTCPLVRLFSLWTHTT